MSSATWPTRSGSATRADTRSQSPFPPRPRSRRLWRSLMGGQRTNIGVGCGRCLPLPSIAGSVQANFAACRGMPYLKAGTITVKQRADERGVIGPPKTVASRRTISISSFLVTMLRQWKIECTPGPLVFGNSRGHVQTLSDIHERAWRPLQRAVRITKADGPPRQQGPARADPTQFASCSATRSA